MRCTKVAYDNDYNKEYDVVQTVATVVTLGGAALGFLGKGVAEFNQDRAERIAQNAQQEYTEAFCSFEKASGRTQATIRAVVSLKKQIMDNQMRCFLKAYKRLNPKISFKNSEGLDELQRFVPGKQEFKELRLSSNVYARYNERNLGSKASNVALVMVQDGTVERIATHVKNIRYAEKIKDSDLKRISTDKLKIESICVLAQFSTVAVEFAIDGVADAVSSIKKVNEAKRYAAEYKQHTEKIKLNTVKIEAIERYANIHIELLEKYLRLLEIYIPRTVKIIREKDNFLHLGRIKQKKFTQNELNIMAFTFSLVGAVKAIVDSPIIAHSGEVYTDNDPAFQKAQNSISTFQEKRLSLPE